MAEHSTIEWTDHTLNPWWGCTKVSPACDHCYTEVWAKRTDHGVWGASMLEDQRALVLLDEANDRVAERNASPLQLHHQRWQIVGSCRHFASIHPDPLRWVLVDEPRSIIREHFRRHRKLPQSPRDTLGIAPETRQYRAFRISHSKVLLQVPLPPASQPSAVPVFGAIPGRTRRGIHCLERRRHTATSVSQSIEGRATLRCRAARARRPFSPRSPHRRDSVLTCACFCPAPDVAASTRRRPVSKLSRTARPGAASGFEAPQDHAELRRTVRAEQPPARGGETVVLKLDR